MSHKIMQNDNFIYMDIMDNFLMPFWIISEHIQLYSEKGRKGPDRPKSWAENCECFLIFVLHAQKKCLLETVLLS